MHLEHSSWTLRRVWRGSLHIYVHHDAPCLNLTASIKACSSLKVSILSRRQRSLALRALC